jgi:hypothetical protein
MRIFWIGSSPTYGAAMNKLRQEAQLHDRRSALVNVTWDVQWSLLWPAFGVRRITLTADVVEFTDPPGE